jgi:hypothetical protein
MFVNSVSKFHASLSSPIPKNPRSANSLCVFLLYISAFPLSPFSNHSIANMAYSSVNMDQIPSSLIISTDSTAREIASVSLYSCASSMIFSSACAITVRRRSEACRSWVGRLHRSHVHLKPQRFIKDWRFGEGRPRRRSKLYQYG